MVENYGRKTMVETLRCYCCEAAHTAELWLEISLSPLLIVIGNEGALLCFMLC